MLAGHEERGCGSLLGPAHGTDCPGASARALCGSRGGAATGEVQRCKEEKPQMKAEGSVILSAVSRNKAGLSGSVPTRGPKRERKKGGIS